MSPHSSPGFVVAVLHQNKPLRESRTNGTSQVYLPFGDEYVLRIKNKTGYRAYVSVKIDGTEISPGRKFILRGHETLDLERFIIDGDLSKGKRFKFISLEEGARTGAIQDPTSPENGTIQVTFEPERTLLMNALYSSSHSDPHQVFGSFINDSHSKGAWDLPLASTLEGCSLNSTNGGNLGSILRGMTFQTQAVNAVPTGQAGATAEGTDSNQTFQDSTEFFLTDLPVTLTIQLRGRVNPEPQTTSYRANVKCLNCGVQTRQMEIQKGHQVVRTPCPNCGLQNLVLD